MAGSDDVRLALHDLGGRGRTTLFAHAAGLHGHVWAPVAEHLATRSRSWGLDLRGHGDSDPFATPLTWSQFETDTLTAARSLDGPLLGVGHSLGGAAMLMAELACPGTFDELVLYEPAVSSPELVVPGIQAMYAGVARRRRAEFESLSEAHENFARKPPTSGFDAGVLRAYTEHGFRTEGPGVRIKCDPESEAAVYESEGTRELWSRLAPARCRTTVIRGAESEIWDPIALETVGRRLGAHLETLPGTGHFGPLMVPESFADLVAAVQDRPGGL